MRTWRWVDRAWRYMLGDNISPQRRELLETLKSALPEPPAWWTEYLASAQADADRRELNSLALMRLPADDSVLWPDLNPAWLTDPYLDRYKEGEDAQKAREDYRTEFALNDAQRDIRTDTAIWDCWLYECLPLSPARCVRKFTFKFPLTMKQAMDEADALCDKLNTLAMRQAMDEADACCDNLNTQHGVRHFYTIKEHRPIAPSGETL